MKKKEASKYLIDEFIGVIPISTIKNKLNKRELNKFWKFMEGQTMEILEKQTGIYYWDLQRFLNDMNDRTLYD